MAASSRAKKKEARNWPDDIIIPSRTFEEQSKLLITLPKPEFRFSMIEWLGMIIDRFGIKPAPSKIEAITQLSQPSTAEEGQVLLGMAA